VIALTLTYIKLRLGLTCNVRVVPLAAARERPQCGSESFRALEARYAESYPQNCRLEANFGDR